MPNAIQYFVWHKRRILPLGHSSLSWFKGDEKIHKVCLCEYGMMILHNVFFHNTLNQVFSPFLLFKQSTSMIKAEESDTKKKSFDRIEQECLEGIF